MNGRTHIFLVAVLAVGCLGVLANIGTAQTNGTSARPPAPPLPVMKSPVDSFRALLVLPNRERKAQLDTRPADVRTKLVEKVREYQALTPDERELRLNATELRWYLKPLMTSGATNRPAQLALIPEHLRDMVAMRIAQWDKFPATIQQLMLTNQAGPAYLVSGSARPLPPSPLGAVHSMLHERFNQLFELTPGEKEKVLATLSDAERRQMEKTLEAFGQLTPQQRQQCLVSFRKFAGMSPEARQEFLKNAERWAQMPAAERQAWRELVSTAPKMPPFPLPPRKAPPLPPQFKKTEGALSTNGG